MWADHRTEHEGYQIWNALVEDLRDEGTHVFQVGYQVYIYIAKRTDLPEAQHVG